MFHLRDDEKLERSKLFVLILLKSLFFFVIFNVFMLILASYTTILVNLLRLIVFPYCIYKISHITMCLGQLFCIPRQATLDRYYKFKITRVFYLLEMSFIILFWQTYNLFLI